MENREVIQQAKKFCEENMISTYPVKIVNLCNNYGINVFEEYLPDDVSGFIVVQKDDFAHYKTNKVISVNLSDTAKRRRFTIAHELAHYILHKPENAPLYAHRDAGQGGELEHEANLFASNILMPEELVREALSEDNYNSLPSSMKISIISNEFAVSLDAARVRLEQLKLV